MAFGMGQANPFMIQRLRRQYEGEPEPMDEVSRPNIGPDVAPAPNLQAPVTQQTPPMSESERYFRAMQDIRSSRPMRSAYQQALLESPDPKNYQPSRWRRLAAAVAGGAMGATGQAGAGIQAAESINRAPYERELESWQSRLRPAQVSAEMESSDVEGQLKSLQDAYAHGLDYNKYLELQRHNQAGERVAAAQAKTARERADIARIVAENPDYEYIEIPGGVRAVDRKGRGETYDIPGKTLEEAKADTARFVAQTGRGMLGVAQTNARTAQRQAEIAGRRADIAENAQRNTASYRNELISDMRERRRIGAEQTEIRWSDANIRALDGALSEMATDPDFEDSIEFDENTGTYRISDDTEQDDYDDVMAEAELRMRRNRRPR